MLVRIISFGNRPYYNEIAEFLLHQIKMVYKSFSYKVYDESDLPDEIIELANKNARGYGYWIWKHFIITTELNKLNDNDILLYIDGRSYFHKYNKINWLDYFIENIDWDVAVWQMSPFFEYQFTIKEILDHFQLPLSDQISYQFASGLILLRKNNKTARLIKQWQDFSSENYLMTTDHFNHLQLDTRFIENRHDQSVFSVLIKKNIREGLKVLILTNDQIRTINSLDFQFRSRPSRFAIYFDRARILLRPLKFILQPFWFRFVVHQSIKDIYSLKGSIKYSKDDKK